MTDEEVLAKYGETRKLHSDYTKTMSEENKAYVVVLAFVIVCFTSLVLVLYIMHNETGRQISQIEQDGRAEEKQQLLEVQNTKSCEEMILLVTRYTHAFWNGTINDQMIQTYKDRCIPK